VALTRAPASQRRAAQERGGRLHRRGLRAGGLARLCAGARAAQPYALARGPAHPALRPQVDDRLNGDGAGIALGVNDPVLGAHLLGVFTAIWALYYIANNSDGFLQSGGKDDDSGLSL
jgi:hypothetical protein